MTRGAGARHARTPPAALVHDPHQHARGREWVAIASGVNEAVDAWVSANYILGSATAANPHDTVGTIDLGGGSVQV